MCATSYSGVDAAWLSLVAPGAQEERRCAKAARLRMAAIVYRGRLQIDEKNGSAIVEEVQPERQRGGNLRIDAL